PSPRTTIDIYPHDGRERSKHIRAVGRRHRDLASQDGGRCIAMAGAAQVVVSSESGLAQEIVSGNHRWRADEPAPFGADTGPSPLSSRSSTRTGGLWIRPPSRSRGS